MRVRKVFNELTTKCAFRTVLGIFPSSSNFPEEGQTFDTVDGSEIRRISQLKLVVEIPLFTGFSYIQNGGWPGHFWTINSIYSHLLLQICAIPQALQLLPEPLLSNDASESSAAF